MAGVFQFPKGRVGVKRTEHPSYKFEKEGEPEIYPVQGIVPDSREEWRVAVVLNRAGVEFDYQYSVGGGKTFRGGQVIDFLVYTVPLPTPLYVQGQYWHRGAVGLEDKFKQSEVMRLMNGQVNPPVLVWDYELTDLDQTRQTLRRVGLII